MQCAFLFTIERITAHGPLPGKYLHLFSTWLFGMAMEYGSRAKFCRFANRSDSWRVLPIAQKSVHSRGGTTSNA